MLWRHPCLVRAFSAAGLLTCAILGSAARAGSEPAEPTPGSRATTETVGILDAQKSGDLAVSVRGQGEDRVHFSLRNTTGKRLNVILPPGLVAASATGQLQSMGLGSVSNGNTGAFGSFRASGTQVGLRSVPASPAERADAVTVPAGQTVEFSIPSVCLNYGLPTPTPRDTFKLVDVDTYSTDPRVRRALRTLATMGTSHGVAQAVMWNVCNNVPFPMMSAQFARLMNRHEVALAARFVEALDASGSSETLDPAYVTEGRVFVRVRAEGQLAGDAGRINGQLDGLHLLGLPVRTFSDAEAPAAAAPALLVNVTLAPGRPGETRGRVTVSYTAVGKGWMPLGAAAFATGSAVSELSGEELVKSVDHAVSAAFVTARPGRRTVGSTTLKIENRLPFTLRSVVVKAGTSAGAPTVALPGLGIGPARLGQTSIEAATASIDRVELNGL